jgi:hypothetical protein
MTKIKNIPDYSMRKETLYDSKKTIEDARAR